MKWVLLFLCCAMLLRCNGGQGTKDAPPPRDVATGEGLYFQDWPPRPSDTPSLDGPPRDAPRDRGLWSDRSAKDQPPPLVDQRPLDLRVPDAPPDTCRTQWPGWSCVVTASGCNATCSAYQLSCVTSFLTICTCKHGTAQKTCSVTGTGCSKCSAAVSKGCCTI